MKKFYKLLTIALTLILAVSLTACGSNAPDQKTDAAPEAQETVYRTLDEIKESGTVNIGVFSDKNPFGYVDENGEYQGYDVYFANRLGEDLGVKVNFVSTEAANRVRTWKPARWTSSWRTSPSRRSARRRWILPCPT